MSRDVRILTSPVVLLKNTMGKISRIDSKCIILFFLLFSLLVNSQETKDSCIKSLKFGGGLLIHLTTQLLPLFYLSKKENSVMNRLFPLVLMENPG